MPSMGTCKDQQEPPDEKGLFPTIFYASTQIKLKFTSEQSSACIPSAPFASSDLAPLCFGLASTVSPGSIQLKKEKGLPRLHLIIKPAGGENGKGGVRFKDVHHPVVITRHQLYNPLRLVADSDQSVLSLPYCFSPLYPRGRCCHNPTH